MPISTRNWRGRRSRPGACPRTAAAAFAVARDYDAVIAPFAGGSMLPAAYLGARRYGRPFVLWASIWAQPRSFAHAAVLPLIRRIYRDADAVVAYGEHARRFIARWRGHDDDIFIAPQAVEPELFARRVSDPSATPSGPRTTSATARSRSTSGAWWLRRASRSCWRPGAARDPRPRW